jgi:hypothetical protein
MDENPQNGGSGTVGRLGMSLTEMVKCRKEKWSFIFLLPEKLLSSFVDTIT